MKVSTFCRLIDFIAKMLLVGFPCLFVRRGGQESGDTIGLEEGSFGVVVAELWNCMLASALLESRRVLPNN